MPRYCDCNQPGVAVHELGHPSFCNRPGWYARWRRFLAQLGLTR